MYVSSSFCYPLLSSCSWAMAKLKICGCISLWLGDDDLFGYMLLNVLVRLVMTVVMIIEYIICLSPDEATLSVDIDGYFSCFSYWSIHRVQIGYQLAILGFLDILITVVSLYPTDLPWFLVVYNDLCLFYERHNYSGISCLDSLLFINRNRVQNDD